MEHGTDFTGLALVAAAATLCGMALARLKQPPIVGYILAGIILGPSGFALVQDRSLVGPLAELGVLMLLYFIGMELSLRSFRRIWKIAVGVSMLQITVSVGIMLLFRFALGWPIEHAILFAFVLALSSTAVAIRMLEAWSPSKQCGWNISQIIRSGGEQVKAGTLFHHAKRYGDNHHE